MSVTSSSRSSAPVLTTPTPSPEPRPASGVESAAAALDRLRRASSRVPVWSARLVFLLGLLAIAAAVMPRRRTLLEWSVDILPPLGIATAAVLGFAVGLGLIIMARGLRRRKRRAWFVVVALLALGIVNHLARGIYPVQTFISCLVLVALVISRKEFVGQPDPRSRRSIPLVLVGMVVVCWTLGCLLTALDRDGLTAGTTISKVMVQSLAGLVGITGPVHFVNPGLADRNATELLGLGIIVVVVTLIALLSSSDTTVSGTDTERSRVRTLLEKYGDSDSLGYFALRDDKSYVFSASGKSAVAYRVVGGVCLAAADPIGDVEAWPGAIEAWLTQARQHAWVPAVLSASETGAQVYGRVGLDALEIGDEAILEVADFTLDGRAMRSVRQAVTRARRAGYRTAITTAADLDAEQLMALQAETASWRSGSGPERGFSMALSRFGSGDDERCVVAEGRGPDGELVALLQLVPWGANGWSLDLMRRGPAEVNGVIEMMLADLVERAREVGISRISLNFAVFRSSLARAERVGAGPVLRLWVGLLLFASRWFQIESLYRANAKLRPTWEPRFVCFATARDLGLVTVAALRAEGFLTRPQLSLRASSKVS